MPRSVDSKKELEKLKMRQAFLAGFCIGEEGWNKEHLKGTSLSEIYKQFEEWFRKANDA